MQLRQVTEEEEEEEGGTPFCFSRCLSKRVLFFFLSFFPENLDLGPSSNVGARVTGIFVSFHDFQRDHAKRNEWGGVGRLFFELGETL